MIEFDSIKEEVRNFYREHEKEIVDKNGKGTLYEFSLSKKWEQFMLETSFLCRSIADHMDRPIDREINYFYFYLDDGSWFIGPCWNNPNIIDLSFHVQLHPYDAAKLALEVSKLAAEAGKEIFLFGSYGFVGCENPNIQIVRIGDEAQELINHVPRRIEWRAEDLKFPPHFFPGKNT